MADAIVIGASSLQGSVVRSPRRSEAELWLPRHFMQYERFKIPDGLSGKTVLKAVNCGRAPAANVFMCI